MTSKRPLPSQIRNPAVSGPFRDRSRWFRDVVPPTGAFLVLLAVWQIGVSITDTPAVLLPSPLRVIGAGHALSGVLLSDAIVTATTAGIGLVIGVSLGLGIGIAIASSRRTGQLLMPYVIALRIAPVIAIAPLVFLWIGRGIIPRAVLVATLTVFPITIATVDGLRSTPEAYLDLATSVDAAFLDVIIRIKLPAAAPSIFAGIKVASTLAIIGAVVAEFVTLNAGLGYRIFETAAFLQTAEMFAALATLATIGIVFYGSAVALEWVLWWPIGDAPTPME